MDTDTTNLAGLPPQLSSTISSGPSEKKVIDASQREQRCLLVSSTNGKQTRNEEVHPKRGSPMYATQPLPRSICSMTSHITLVINNHPSSTSFHRFKSPSQAEFMLSHRLQVPSLIFTSIAKDQRNLPTARPTRTILSTALQQTATTPQQKKQQLTL
jgi:hypothetical protein